MKKYLWRLLLVLPMVISSAVVVSGLFLGYTPNKDGAAEKFFAFVDDNCKI